MEFNIQEIKENLIIWIREWFEENGKGCNAVIGISGGKDSSVCAALCVEALGKDRVIGVLMPNLKQEDIDDSYQIVEYLGIKSFTIPISIATAGLYNQLRYAGVQISEQATIDLPTQIRMVTLYAVAKSLNGRVVDTCNLSKNRIGGISRYGDVSPLGKLTVQEIRVLSKEFRLPSNIANKISSKGECGFNDLS